jgi:hypothetical protein
LKKNLAFAAIALVLLLGAAFQSPNSVSVQLNAIQSQLTALQAQNASLAAQVATSTPRKFYLTKTFHAGNQALSACDTGYHMASLWEIHEPSNLRYDTGRGSLGVDSGSGPTSESVGWIRTGNTLASAVANPGVANCNGWTTDSSGSNGTVAGLNIFWGPPPAGEQVSRVNPWNASAFQCNFQEPVWCVQD